MVATKRLFGDAPVRNSAMTLAMAPPFGDDDYEPGI
jgi:hypothetical protein